MYEITNITSKDNYAESKAFLRFESVPNTAVGYENCRKFIVDTRFGHRYMLSAMNEKDYFLHNEKDGFSVWFSVDGDKVTAKSANYRGRAETSARYLKKYAMVLCLAHSCIKYDQIVTYRAS